MSRAYRLTPDALEQRRQAGLQNQTPAHIRRKVIRLAGQQSPSGRWEMPVRAIGKLVGLSGARVQQILAAHAQRMKATAA